MATYKSVWQIRQSGNLHETEKIVVAKFLGYSLF